MLRALLEAIAGDATEVPQTWDRFSNDSCYRQEQEVEEEEEEPQIPREGCDWSGGDLEGEDTSSDYDEPSSPYTRSLR